MSDLYKSIVPPNSFVIRGFQSDVMPDDFGTRLGQRELADLIACLMAMKCSGLYIRLYSK